MSTIFEKIYQEIKKTNKDKTERIKKEVKEEVVHERLETLGDRLDFWGKCKATLKIWS